MHVQVQTPAGCFVRPWGNKLASVLNFQLPGLWEYRRLLCKTHSREDGILPCQPWQTHTGSTKGPQESCGEGHVYRGEGEAVGISNLLALETGMMELHAEEMLEAPEDKEERKPCSSKEATSSHTLLSP